MTTVYNLATNEYAEYSQPPTIAVRLAHLQLTLGRYDTWAYTLDDIDITTGDKTVACGDWCALTPRTIDNYLSKYEENE